LDVVCSEVERDGDNWNRLARVQRHHSSADRPCAQVLPLLLGKPLDEAHASRARQAFAIALTHATDEIRLHAAVGTSRHLWASDPELALRCVNGLATAAMWVQDQLNIELSRPPEPQRQLDEIEAEAAALLRSRLFQADAIANDAYQIMDPSTWFGAKANEQILCILGQAPTEDLAITAFERLSHTLTTWWDAEDDWRKNRSEERPEKSHETELLLSELLYAFLLRTTGAAATNIVQPIADAVDRHPEKVRWFLLGLIGAEDGQANTPQFWTLWKLFAERVRCAKWLGKIDSQHADEREMVSAIFLGSWWKDDVRHWRSLEGHAWHVHDLFEGLPPSSTVLEAYLYFLSHIGEQSLPDAFVRILKRLQQGDAQQMLRKENIVFMLEVLLQRYVYGRALELKRRPELRNSVVSLLDLLVANGSSAAFRMRDDFVTPMSTS